MKVKMKRRGASWIMEIDGKEVLQSWIIHGAGKLNVAELREKIEKVMETGCEIGEGK